MKISTEKKQSSKTPFTQLQKCKNKKMQINQMTQLQEWTNEAISQTAAVHQSKIQEWKKIHTTTHNPYQRKKMTWMNT